MRARAESSNATNAVAMVDSKYTLRLTFDQRDRVHRVPIVNPLNLLPFL